MLVFPRTLAEATAATGDFRAGGTDLQDRRRLRVSGGPLVDLRDLAGLDGITWQADGSLVLGAQVTISQLASDAKIAAAYPGLAQAAAGLATPQIRSVATVAGNLLQQVRCWYYRHPTLRCLRSGGESCLAREGDHLFHVCFDRGPCVAPHPSTLATALLAYAGSVELSDGRFLAATQLFGDGSDPRQSHTLASGQLLAHIVLPPPAANERAIYLRATNRTRAEWPLVEVVARLFSDASGPQAAVVVGGVAPIPLRLPNVEQALRGPLQPAELEAAAQRATDGAKALPQTEYKLELLRGLVLTALEKLVAAPTSRAAASPDRSPTHGTL